MTQQNKEHRGREAKGVGIQRGASIPHIPKFNINMSKSTVKSKKKEQENNWILFNTQHIE